MPDGEFKPKFAKQKPDRGITSGRVTRMVVKAAKRQRAARPPWANALTKRPVAELGRGKGAFYGLSPPQPGWRRVIVKARIARHGTSDLAAARAHQHYIMRDGVTRDGGSGQLYDRERDTIDAGDFLDSQKSDTYQFRLIIAPEDGARMADLKPFIRDLMATMQDDLGTKLDWVAVDHFNTGHPHTHVIIAGHDDRGQDLVMARHYISHGIRTRARDLVTLELGPELEFERVIKLANEMKAERFTSLDYGILNDAKENVLVVPALAPGEHLSGAVHPSLRIGRLRRLEQMGLADEKQTGVWAIDAQLDTKLRSMGERGNILGLMTQVMREHGMDRAAGDFAIFSGARKATPAIGKVVEAGMLDDMSDRKYLVVDGIDGRIHYAETSTLQAHDGPTPGMIVALTSGSGKTKVRNAQIEIVSYVPIEKLASIDAATWLDRTIVAEKRPAIREKGFGAAVSKALVAREAWLIANGLAKSSEPGTITPKPDMLRDLDTRGLLLVADRLSAEFKMPHFAPIEGLRITGQHVRTIDLPTMRLAVIKGREDFTLVPWRPELMQMHGKDIAIGVHDRAITLSVARVRDLGLSR